MPYEPPQTSNPGWIADLKKGKFALGCSINTSSPLVTEMCSALGYDYLLIDQQHSAIDPEKLRTLLQACHAGGSKAFVRVGGCYDRVGIQQALDLGADGLLVPCANTVEDVKHAVSCAKYPVAGPGSEGGSRSVFVNLRAQLPGGFNSLFDYVQHRGNNESILAFQIETNSALECVEEICAVPGVDVAFIGPGDLAVSMGLVREVGMPACWSSPEFAKAEKRVAAACKANNVVAGYWNSSLEEKGALGFRFFVADGDLMSMYLALEKSIKEKKELVKKLETN